MSSIPSEPPLTTGASRRYCYISGFHRNVIKIIVNSYPIEYLSPEAKRRKNCKIGDYGEAGGTHLFFHLLKKVLKVALQVLERTFYKNTKKSSMYSQGLLIFILVVKRHPITREIRDLLWPTSTPTGNTVYFYMSSSFIYTLKILRRSFNHGVR